MSWFKRIKENIQTQTKNKRETPDGLWWQCPKCKNALTTNDLSDNNWVCNKCEYHERINSEKYFQLFFDNNEYEELFGELEPRDILHFNDLKSYESRLRDTVKKTGLKDAMRVGFGKSYGNNLTVACMDFEFIGGSMGTIVGEKIARAIDHCLITNSPLLIISKSGGARMMESGLSLMQMAKTSAKLTQLSDKKIPYISLMTDPTTGGVTASFAMLGDLNIAEPKALIGFAGPRVIMETIKAKKLPEGFQTSESLLENGFLDEIVHRKNLKAFIHKVTQHLLH
jgi:acetyl-CoA carboxylase carboxyl transferase subunit beta